jgi:hypothetical protein
MTNVVAAHETTGVEQLGDKDANESRRETAIVVGLEKLIQIHG